MTASRIDRTWLDSKRTRVESCELEESIYKQSYAVVESPFDRARLNLFG